MSTTETSQVEPAPTKPKPAATKVEPAKLQPEPEVEARSPTRAGPKWKGPMTRGGPKWRGLDERPRVTREPIHATEPEKGEKQ